MQDKKNEDEYQQEQMNVLNELFRIIKPGGSFFYNHKTRWEQGVMIHPMQWLLKTNWTIRQEIIWDRMIAANIRGWRYWQVDERIYWLYKPIGHHKIGEEILSKHAKLSSIWRFPPERKNTHPAPFPIDLPTRVIATILNDDGIVIDPYSGSGTTLVAAKLLQKQYIGIEISNEYNQQAENRLKNYLNENNEVVKELANHTIEKSFKERKDNGEWLGKHKKNQKVDNHTISNKKMIKELEF
ncbi:MAG: DNA-methyltransferase [Chitinophagaceae bacterium]